MLVSTVARMEHVNIIWETLNLIQEQKIVKQNAIFKIKNALLKQKRDFLNQNRKSYMGKWVQRLPHIFDYARLRCVGVG